MHTAHMYLRMCKGSAEPSPPVCLHICTQLRHTAQLHTTVQIGLCQLHAFFTYFPFFIPPHSFLFSIPIPVHLLSFLPSTSASSSYLFRTSPSFPLLLILAQRCAAGGLPCTCTRGGRGRGAAAGTKGHLPMLRLWLSHQVEDGKKTDGRDGARHQLGRAIHVHIKVVCFLHSSGICIIQAEHEVQSHYHYVSSAVHCLHTHKYAQRYLQLACPFQPVLAHLAR
mmetsp:Transcript_11235/g.29662  ORF Transcript_11235/g.29662 Transcript_11235/m.29662 type:complete len:224 (+) Transcript_11235:409-1080(+)